MVWHRCKAVWNSTCLKLKGYGTNSSCFLTPDFGSVLVEQFVFMNSEIILVNLVNLLSNCLVCQSFFVVELFIVDQLAIKNKKCSKFSGLLWTLETSPVHRVAAQWSYVPTLFPYILWTSDGCMEMARPGQ